MTLNRSVLTRIITFLGGLYFVVEFLLPKRVLEAVGVAQYHDSLSTGFITVGAVSFGLGLINIVKHHGSKVLFVRKGWIHSTALLVGLMTMMSVTLWDWYNSEVITRQVDRVTLLSSFAERIYQDSLIEQVAEGEETQVDVIEKNSPPPLLKRVAILLSESSTLRNQLLDRELSVTAQEIGEVQMQSFEDALELVEKDRVAGIFSQEAQGTLSTALQGVGTQMGVVLRQKQAAGTVKNVYDFLFLGLFTALGSAMFSLLAVYIVAAAYRAFVVKSFESFLMMAAAVLVILGQTSFGLYISEYFPAIRLWLLEVPNSAAFRAIKIGAGVAGLVMALRMWFSIESETFSGEGVS